LQLANSKPQSPYRQMRVFRAARMGRSRQRGPLRRKSRLSLSQSQTRALRSVFIQLSKFYASYVARPVMLDKAGGDMVPLHNLRPPKENEATGISIRCPLYIEDLRP
jgi:hypothetical protein